MGFTILCSITKALNVGGKKSTLYFGCFVANNKLARAEFVSRPRVSFIATLFGEFWFVFISSAMNKVLCFFCFVWFYLKKITASQWQTEQKTAVMIQFDHC